METREYSVYNSTRGTILIEGVTVVDTHLEPLLVLKVLIEGLALDSQTGLWLSPLDSIPTVPRISPFYLVYLDAGHRVIEGFEVLPGVNFPPFKAPAISALVLPLHSVISSRTTPGDQLRISVVEEMIRQPAAVLESNGVALHEGSESKIHQAVTRDWETESPVAVGFPMESEAQFRAEEMTMPSVDVFMAAAPGPVPLSTELSAIQFWGNDVSDSSRSEALLGSESPKVQWLDEIERIERPIKSVASSGVRDSSLKDTTDQKPTEMASFEPQPEQVDFPASRTRSKKKPPKYLRARDASGNARVNGNADAEFKEPPASVPPASAVPDTVAKGNELPSIQHALEAQPAAVLPAAPVTAPAEMVEPAVAPAPISKVPVVPAAETDESVDSFVEESPIFPITKPIIPIAAATDRDLLEEFPFWRVPAPFPPGSGTPSTDSQGDDIPVWPISRTNIPASAAPSAFSPTAPFQKPPVRGPAEASTPLKIPEYPFEGAPGKDAFAGPGPQNRKWQPSSQVGQSNVEERARQRTNAPAKETRTPAETGKVIGKVKKAAGPANKKSLMASRFHRWRDTSVPEAVSAPLDRRRSNRKVIPGLVAFYWTGGTPQPYEVSNISGSGFYLVTKSHWMYDTMIRMTLQRSDVKEGHPKHAITVLAKVVRSGVDGLGHEFVMSDSIDQIDRDVRPEKGTSKRALEQFL